MSNEQQQKTQVSEKHIDKKVTSDLSLAKGGALEFANVTQIMEVAKLMAISQIAIPGHLRDNPGACLAVAIQASEWQMSPFAVANKSYSVNNRLAYEAQLVAAVILKRAPIVGRIRYKYEGEGGKRRCTTSATLSDDGEVVEYTSPEFDKIPIKNSPLWKADPDQQLGYYSVRAMCRRHFPDVLLGIYTPEEMAEQTMREVTPASETAKPKFLSRTTVATDPAAQESEHGQPQEQESAADQTARPEPAPETPGDHPQDGDAERNNLIREIETMRSSDGVSVMQIRKWAHQNGLCASTAITFANYSVESLKAIVEKWEEVKG